MIAMEGAGTAMAVPAMEQPRPSKCGPLPRWSADRTDELVALLVRGDTYGSIARQMGVTRAKIAGKVRQLRVAGDPRLAEAAPRRTGRVKKGLPRAQINALADAMANGAASVAAAGRALGISQPRASTLWGIIRGELGGQAQ